MRVLVNVINFVRVHTLRYLLSESNFITRVMHKEQSSHLHFSSQISCPERDMTLTHEMTLFLPPTSSKLSRQQFYYQNVSSNPGSPLSLGHIQTDYSDEFELFKVNTCLLKLRWFYIFNNDWMPLITDGQQRQCLQWSNKIHSLSRGVLFWLSIFFIWLWTFLSYNNFFIWLWILLS